MQGHVTSRGHGGEEDGWIIIERYSYFHFTVSNSLIPLQEVMAKLV